MMASDGRLSLTDYCDRQGSVDRQLVFRINENGVGPDLLHQVFAERGWIEYDEEIHGEHGWNMWWRTTRFRTGDYHGLYPWQRINHYPNCTMITRKDALCRNLRKMSIAHGLNSYNFSPTAYNLPNDYTKFVSDYARLKQQHPKKDPPLMWICKPAESSRGRGIFIFGDLSDLQYDCNAVVQQYITDPLLIGGYKFDIRVYVAVSSFQPLQIYIHEEGLVRFSTEKYDLDRPDNVFAHLTNTSINKYSPGYTTDKEEVGHGCKWTISQLRRYLLQNNIPDGPLWQQITNIIILTLLMQAPAAPKATNCFELYGFDILVDSSLKPWLLEVNFSPALSADCQADVFAKKAMLSDLIDLIFRAEAGFDFDFELNKSLTDRTAISVNSSSKSYRSNSRRSFQKLRPTPSSHTVYSDRTSQCLDLKDESEESTSYHQLRKASITSNMSSDGRSKSRRAKNELPLIEKRKPVLKSPAPWLESRNLSRPNSELEYHVGKGMLSRETSNHVCSQEVNNSEQQETETLRKIQQRKLHTESVKVEQSNNLKLPNGNVNDRHSVFLQECNQNLVFPYHRLSQGYEINSESAVENTVEPVESKTSTTSDSGMSSLSLNSCENNAAAVTDTNSHPGLVGNGLPSIEVTNINSSNSANKLRVPSDLISHLNEQPPKLNLSSVYSPSLEMDIVDNFNPEHDKNNSEIKIVHGNMRGSGMKKIISPIASPGLSKASRPHLPQSTHTYGDHNLEQRRTNKVVKLQRSRTRGQSFDPHPADNKSMIPFNIPRNFSRAESYQFPFHFHHGRNPGKNGRAPLTKIPSRKVGRFFLVFPFNEATQKLSQGKLEPKLVIKELQKHNREVDKTRKKVASTIASSLADDSSIWSPIGDTV